VKAIGDFQSQALGAPSSIAQYALEKSLLSCEKEISEVNSMLKKRMQMAMEGFRVLPQFKVYEPQGAFYLWIDISAVLGKSFQGQIVKDSKTFCEILLHKFHVATVPGIESGCEGFMRLSFANDPQRFQEAIGRMKSFVDQLINPTEQL
jgi:aspartate aminotransferase